MFLKNKVLDFSDTFCMLNWVGALQEKYRGRQIYQFLYKGKTKNIDNFLQCIFAESYQYKAQFQECLWFYILLPFLSTVPKKFRELLITENWKVGRSEVHHTVVSKDGTIKVSISGEESSKIFQKVYLINNLQLFYLITIRLHDVP